MSIVIHTAPRRNPILPHEPAPLVQISIGFAGPTLRRQNFKKVEMIDLARTRLGHSNRSLGSRVTSFSETNHLSAMAIQHPKSASLFLRFWRWSKDQIVQTVPDDISLCEYDCRKPQCAADEWENCDYRSNKAAGKLMPDTADPVTKSLKP